jgi:hypothetical protein
MEEELNIVEESLSTSMRELLAELAQRRESRRVFSDSGLSPPPTPPMNIYFIAHFNERIPLIRDMPEIEYTNTSHNIQRFTEYDDPTNSEPRECNICYEMKSGEHKSPFVRLNCKHEMCNKCFNNIKKKPQPKCPFCRETINTATMLIRL